MERQEIERVLAESLYVPLSPEELEELVRRVQAQERTALLLRQWQPLREGEPDWPAAPEERP
jgi:hypothetical protein